MSTLGKIRLSTIVVQKVYKDEYGWRITIIPTKSHT
jgi:hypothetical protein